MGSIHLRSAVGLCTILTAAAGVVAGIGWPVPAAAQLLDNVLVPGRLVDPLPTVVGPADETVVDRPRTSFDPLGVRVGDFIIRPQVSEGVLLDNNVLGRPNGRSVPAERTQASLQAVSDFNRNGIAVNLSVDDLHYFDSDPLTSAQSRTNWQAGIGGFYEVGRGRILFDYTHATQTQQITDIGFPGGTVPIPYNVDTVRLAYRTAPGGLSFEPNVQFSAFRFDQSQQQAGSGFGRQVTGQTTTQFSDRNVLSGGLITRYQVGERRDIVVSIQGAAGSYLQTAPGQPSRDYSGVAVLAGIDYGLPAFYRVRLLAGFQTREFASSAYRARIVPVAEAEVVWDPTRRTTVTGTVTRRIEDSQSEALQGFTYTRARLQLDHELLRDVLLQGYGQVEQADYLQNSRTETIASLGGSSTLLLNRHLRVSASYSYEHFNSNQSPTYDRSVALLQFTFGL